MTSTDPVSALGTNGAGPGPSRAQLEYVVDLDAIAHNTGVLREHAGSAGIMAVVKADAYNHGAAAVSRAVLASGASELGVTTIGEALALRNAGITAPILAWLHQLDADYDAAIVGDVEIGVSSPRHLARVVAAARRVGRPAAVTLKIDTGLNRNGVAPDEWEATVIAAARASAEGAIEVRGAFTHLSHADEPGHPTIDLQKTAFDAALDGLRRAGLKPARVHMANSAATLTRPDLRYDMVRPGISVYGFSPVPQLGTFGLRPAMTVRAQVILVKRVRAGEGVSYGHLWTAERDTTVALIPMGYADGLPRTLSGRFEVQLGGRRRRAIGRVCMDQFVVDLGENEDGVEEGDDAYVFGNGDHGEPSAQAWADALDTITYEIVCGIKGRTTRSIVGGGTVAGAPGGNGR
ncbi:alanine racemase [Rhodococcus rhodnii]|uniref:Alanine racemase n=2 Tax=Rhodococcus rhodnii TaxID=38312 RepID=R7WWU8_9NOCA|nr:alanine racemase [Rhodococcus rhodnii]EOM78624.1 alanine racemase [Rhodococcus rhodnii LMG 5362]TXG90445.1 alanine racemase [Rhodococcus rhodnii]